MINEEVGNNTIPIEKGEIISPTVFNRRRQDIFDAVANGKRFIVERKGKKLAVLIPYENHSGQREISQREIDILELVKGISPEKLKMIIDIARGEIKLIDLEEK